MDIKGNNIEILRGLKNGFLNDKKNVKDNDSISAQIKKAISENPEIEIIFLYKRSRVHDYNDKEMIDCPLFEKFEFERKEVLLAPLLLKPRHELYLSREQLRNDYIEIFKKEGYNDEEIDYLTKECMDLLEDFWKDTIIIWLTR